MTEKELQKAVVECAAMLGWRLYHTFDSRKSSYGFPDLCMIRPPRLLFAELKSQSGHLSHYQQDWLEELKRTGVEVFVWRPEDWTSGAVELVLR